jgi:hypothetical protein
MSTRVVVPQPLSALAGGGSLDVAARDLESLMQMLARKYALDDALVRADGGLQSFVRVTVDGRPVPARTPEERHAIAVAGRTVRIAVAFAGG